ncbi:hypothetical protein A4G99_07825 [Haladaptatus sp. R4]|uniref:DUF5789 family protein n=1 Tax=Haladaptatus sp. R4 TaxID=1679489 RepID=UPI0007B48588|nr:DUF5789 family protein [Haladaptatus sp. R4]KZN24315.1 hypothetical protein A4G99_07825 [Haladaptatus sp. R4]
MADDNEDEGPAVELGDGEPVDGAPIARISSRLFWPIQKSEIARREGSETIRTPDGPQQLDAVLEDVDMTYFQTEQAFTGAIRDVIGTGPVPTADDS